MHASLSTQLSRFALWVFIATAACSKGRGPIIDPVVARLEGLIAAAYGLPIQGVEILVDGQPAGVRSDVSGRFSIQRSNTTPIRVTPSLDGVVFDPPEHRVESTTTQVEFTATAQPLGAPERRHVSGRIDLPQPYAVGWQELRLRTAYGSVPLQSGYGFLGLPVPRLEGWQFVFLEDAAQNVLATFSLEAWQLAAGTVQLGAREAALALVGANPLLTSLAQASQRQVLLEAEAHQLFPSLVDAVRAAWATAPRLAMDYETFPHLFEKGIGIGVQVMESYAQRPSSSIGDPSRLHLTDEAGNTVAIRNPYQVFYGAQFSGRPPVLVPGRAGLFELGIWPPRIGATPPEQTDVDLPDGAYTVIFYKGFNVEEQWWLDPRTAAGLATYANGVKAIGIGLEVAKLFVPGAASIPDFLTDNRIITLLLDRAASSPIDFAVLGEAVARGAWIDVVNDSLEIIVEHWDDIAYWVWQEWPGEGTAQFMRSLGRLTRSVSTALSRALALYSSAAFTFANEHLPFLVDLVATAPWKVQYEFDHTSGQLAPRGAGIDHPPELHVETTPAQPLVGITVTVDASASRDDRPGLLFRFDVGNDGSFERAWSTDPVFRFTPGDRGVVALRIEAKDSASQVARALRDIYVGSLDAVKIVLTWGERPRDLDSHLWTPVIEGASYHVYYGRRYPDLRRPPYVMLDVDDTTSYGPETIWFERIFAGTYTYAVHNYSGESVLAGCEAQVQFIRRGEVVSSFRVPGTGTGRWWHVFDMDGGTLAITPRNVILQGSPR